MVAFWEGFYVILALLGAIGLFLFSIKLMGEALQKIAGQGMRLIISRLAQNSLRGVFSGLGITAAIQSSSAVTVMLVSLSGAGLLSFRESFSMIMGANIGTTLKAWLLALFGFSFDPTSLALPLIALSLLLLFSGKEKRRFTGEFFTGLALLFISLEFIKNEATVLTLNPVVADFLQEAGGRAWYHYLMFSFIGFLMTALLQSSSAMMAFTLALAGTGNISFEMAIAMVLGENLGTTLTANLAALMGDYRAKRTALSHFLFNLSGFILVLLVFPLVIQRLTWLLEVLRISASLKIPVGLAAFHTSFNLIITLLWINFIPQMYYLVSWLIPEQPSRRLDKYAFSYIISTAEFSLLQGKNELARLSGMVSSLARMTSKLLITRDPEQSTALKNNFQILSEEILKSQRQLELYLQNLPINELSQQGRIRHQFMLITAEHLLQITRILKKMLIILTEKEESRVWFTPKQYQNLIELSDLVLGAFALLEEHLNGDYHRANISKAMIIEEKINHLRDKIKNKIPKKIEAGKITPASAEYFKGLIDTWESTGDLIASINQGLATCSYAPAENS
ncbi:MAG: Na/Pi cotransporter family protein [Bacteroidales bacterium]